MRIKVYVTLKNGVLDPQGKAIENALGQLGFSGVDDVRQGKLIELTVAETDAQKAKEQAAQMCEKLLANTVVEDYTIEVAA